MSWASGLRLRRAVDRRALSWIALASLVAAVSWSVPAARRPLLPLAGYLAFAAGLVAHAHNHCRMFRGRRTNVAFDFVLTLFFGFPTFVWVAGHNRYHHRFNNRPRDPSASWRLFHRHNLITAIVTPVFVMIYEPVVWPFLVDAWRSDRRRFVLHMVHLGFYLGVVAGGLACDAHAFLWAFVLPWAIGLYTVHFANYVQHVHCDSWSRYAHSRDWTGRAVNFFTFNQGFHTVHHNRPGAHWSEWRALHDQVRDRIPAELQSDNLLWWAIRQYLLAPFAPRLGTRQLGRAPWTAPS